MKAPRKNEIVVAFTTANGITVEVRRPANSYTQLQFNHHEELNAASTAAIKALLDALDHSPLQYRVALNATPLQSVTQ